MIKPKVNEPQVNHSVRDVFGENCSLTGVYDMYFRYAVKL